MRIIYLGKESYENKSSFEFSVIKETRQLCIRSVDLLQN